MDTNELNILRIKQLIEYLGISNGNFADKIGIDRSVFSRYMTGKQRITFELLGKIVVAYPEFNPSWVLKGCGNMLSPATTTINVNRGGDISGNSASNINSPSGSINSPMGFKTTQNECANGTPYYNIESAVCGVLSGFGEALTANNSDGAVVIPTLQTKDGDIFLQTRGRSMIDTKCPERSIPEGAMVLVRRWSHNFIEWGEMYCLATSDGYVIKRLMPGADNSKILCVSADSDNYPAYEVLIDDIKAIGRVIAVVSTQML